MAAARGSLRPVAASFLVFGAFAGTWAVAAVDVERTFGLTDAQLGLLLAGGIAAATGIAAFSGALTDRWGAGTALAGALVLWGALLAFASGAPRVALFAPLFIVALAAGGMVDVVMNIVAADALAPEPARLVRFHGLFNGAAVLGAAVTGVALDVGVSWRVVWLAIAIVAGLTAALVRASNVPEPPRADGPMSG